MKKLYISFLLITLVTCGCASAGHIIMKNPQSGAIFDCKGDPWQDWNPYRSAQKCAEALQKDGWMQLGSDARFQKSPEVAGPSGAHP